MDLSGDDIDSGDSSDDDDELERAREEGRKPKIAPKAPAAKASKKQAAGRKAPESESEGDGEDGGDGEEEDVSDDDVYEKPQHISQTQQKNGRHAAPESEDEEDDDDDSDEEGERSASHRGAGTSRKDGKFFAKTPDGTKFAAKSFADLGLSRPLVKACATLGYTHPTPIQAACIPLAMSGRDICGSAMTGSGKTAAFGLPALERLLHRDKKHTSTYVLILTPTRELAAQIHSMLSKLGQFTDIRILLCVGGLSLKEQEAAMRTRPEIVVATPGRLIDLLMNARAVDLDDLATLVLDEADKLLEMGFMDEVKQIVKLCPKRRQTLLFSATMTDQVERLSAVSLQAPVRLAADQAYSAPRDLVQEVLRLKGAAGESKEAALLALCSRSLQQGRTIIFCGRKQHAHRMKVVFGLCGLPAAGELHGNMTQAERLLSLDRFRKGEVKYLLCTDVAARGLDILGVETVVNYDAPQQLATYMHRIGRTARAGRNGRAVTFVTDRDRNLLKQVVKSQKGVSMKTRVIPPAAIRAAEEQLEAIQGDLGEILAEEREEAYMRKAEMEAGKADNMMQHEREIKSRPKREWFQTGKEKAQLKKRVKDSYAGGAEDDEEEEGAARSKADKYKEKADLKKKRAMDAAIEEATGKKKRKLSESEQEMEKSYVTSRGYKSLQRKLIQDGVNPRAAAKIAAKETTRAPAELKKRKKTATTKGLFGDNLGGPTAGGAAGGAPGATKVYAGGYKSQEVRAPREGLSDKQKKKISRGGKGKSAFKSKSKYKRKK